MFVLDMDKEFGSAYNVHGLCYFNYVFWEFVGYFAQHFLSVANVDEDDDKIIVIIKMKRKKQMKISKNSCWYVTKNWTLIDVCCGIQRWRFLAIRKWYDETFAWIYWF